MKAVLDAEAQHEAEAAAVGEAPDAVVESADPVVKDADPVDDEAPKPKRRPGWQEGRRQPAGRGGAAGAHQGGDGVSPDGLHVSADC